MPMLKYTDSAVECQWHAWHARLKRYFQSRVSQAADAEDMVQIVLQKVLSQQSQLRNPAAMQGWVYRIAHNVLMDYYRARTHPTFVEFDEHDHSESDTAEKNSVAACLMCMSESLTADERHLLQQVDIEQASQKQLAASLNIPYASLKSRVQRTRRKLKQKLLDCCAVEFDRTGQPVALLDATC